MKLSLYSIDKPVGGISLLIGKSIDRIFYNKTVEDSEVILIECSDGTVLELSAYDDMDCKGDLRANMVACVPVNKEHINRYYEFKE